MLHVVALRYACSQQCTSKAPDHLEGTARKTILNVNDELRLYFILVLLSSIIQVCKLKI